ncbi:MAG: methionine--tRNA ligase [Lachnospiraceae bacterium]|nr:methionine--tRNA ligase [Lachnospiraceae bacterium]
MANKYYITTAIVYTSGKPHIGNVYDVVLADAIARFKGEQGFDVFYMTGTDEHGEKIEKKASEEGLTPKEFVDKIANDVKRVYDLIGTSYNRFIRTTDEDHVKACQNIFKKLYDKGDIYKGEYEGWYCTPCESFFTDSQLVDGKCPDCGREVYKAKEEAYFFKMSKYADKLIDYIKNNDFIKPDSRKNEMLNNFLLPGLKDLCVSRSTFKWGIPVSFDDKHVIYVWLDALNNYITGLGYDGNTESETFKKYWPADLHVIGKDIVRFHTIYWPIFLMALDLPLPKKVFGHPWLLAANEGSKEDDGTKMSKSRGNVLYPDELIKIFGVDGVRFYLLHEMPYDNDGVVSLKLVTERYNTDLANVLGNLVSRTIAMINKYFAGTLEDKNVKEEFDDNLYTVANDCIDKTVKSMEDLKIQDAVESAFDIFRRCNKYIDETEPWAIAKDPSKEDRLKTVLYNLSTNICKGAKLINCFMPETSEKILSMFNVSNIALNNLKEFKIKNGTNVTNEKENLFARLELKDVESAME